MMLKFERRAGCRAAVVKLALVAQAAFLALGGTAASAHASQAVKAVQPLADLGWKYASKHG